LSHEIFQFDEIQDKCHLYFNIDHLYCLSYKPDIPWIDALNVFISESGNDDMKGLALVTDDLLSTVKETDDFYKYITVGILLNNVDSNNLKVIC